VEVDLRLQRAVETAHGAHLARPVLYVHCMAEDTDGWGECAALGTGTVVDPTLATVVDRLQHLDAGPVPGWWRDGFPDPLGAPTPPGGLEAEGGMDAPGRLAWAAIEMACLDAALRAAHLPLARWLGVEDAVVPVGGLIGMPADRRTSRVVAAAERVVAQGVRRLRVKIAPGFDRAPLEAVRARFPGLLIQADANGAYRPGSRGPDDARCLEPLDDLGLGCIEQPFPPDLPLHAVAHLAAHLATPVALDESLVDQAAIREAVATGACQVACLKPGRLGGVAATQAAATFCQANGVPAFIGGFFESGLGRAVNTALSGLPGCSLPGDITAPATYLVADPCAGLPADPDRLPPRGFARTPDSPGAGPSPVVEGREAQPISLPVSGRRPLGA